MGTACQTRFPLPNMIFKLYVCQFHSHACHVKLYCSMGFDVLLETAVGGFVRVLPKDVLGVVGRAVGKLCYHVIEQL